MASRTVRLATGSTTNLTLLSVSPALNLTGLLATNTAAYAIFVKFYWFDKSTGAAVAPTVGTTLPDLTINVPTASSFNIRFDGITKRGDLWVAVTKLAADTDTTATVAGDGLITFFLG